MNIIGGFFAVILNWCYELTRNYGWAIVIFTILTRVIMIPISVMVQVNSIKMVKMYPEMNLIKARYFGNKDMISEENYKLYKRDKYHPMLDLVPVILQLILLMGVIEGIKRTSIDNTWFAGFDLSLISGHVLGKYILIPIIAALSAWFMCFIQNRVNVLQSEQSKVNKYTTMGISVGLSLYLGFLVNGGVAMYWTVGNLLAVVQLYILNACINPKKHIDYQALAESRAELDKVEQYHKSAKSQMSKEDQLREKQDYRRFFKYGYKQIVFYAEKKGFYKYFKNVIEYILEKTDIVIHYISGDPADDIYEKESERFKTYYIGENKLIVLMMKLEADIMVMTTPDLQTYHLKKSIVQDNIEYIYMDHAMGDVNLSYRKHALDHFDTIFVPNELTEREIREQERIYNLPAKNIIRTGYGLIDDMIADYSRKERTKNETPEILIAPSWQQDNLLDLCIGEILDQLLGRGYHVTLRPHPQYVRLFGDKLAELGEKYKDHRDFELQKDFSSNKTVMDADVMLTDWSGIAYEYSFTTLKPTLYINTPMKIINPDYEEIGIEPFDVTVRDEIGVSVDVDKLDTVADSVHRLLTEQLYSPESIAAVRDKYLDNIGHSGETGARYIIKKLIEYSKR